VQQPLHLRAVQDAPPHASLRQHPQSGQHTAADHERPRRRRARAARACRRQALDEGGQHVAVQRAQQEAERELRGGLAGLQEDVG
jgi:hypothetical protein